MNFRAAVPALAVLCLILGLAMGLCGAAAALMGDPAEAREGLWISASLCLAVGLMLRFAVRDALEPTRRDGFGIVTMGWMILTFLGALPYLASGVLRDPMDAVFETLSGFSTTGASVIPDVESLPRGILLWRTGTNWLGGMGVLVLCIAILPFIGGMQIFQAEVTGPSKDRLTPRIAATAKWLWGIYVLLTGVEAVLLRLGGLSWYDAICHAFTTMSTGGFSTRNASIGAYPSLYVELVVMVFMLVGAINFTLHFRALRGDFRGYWRDTEFVFYGGFWLMACLALTVSVRLGGTASWFEAWRQAFFNGTSILTTTGFATVDFDRWPAFSGYLLVLFMIMGGCAGSTAGGIKAIRVLVVFKMAVRSIRAYLQPQAVFLIKVGRETLDDARGLAMLAYAMAYLLTLLVGALAMSVYAPNLRTALSAVAATMGGVGPGLGAVGPMTTYADIPAAGKAILSICMLLGRLEIYSVLALFMPSFWKR